jgi:DNA-binding transcriptional regulator YiaG
MNAKALKKLRRAVGMTQHALSVATGITETRLCFCETGRLTLTREEVELIRAAIQKRLEQNAELIGALAV